MILSVRQAAATAPLRSAWTGVGWWDSITGVGLVRGGVVLLHGAPGAGKSTALAQVAGKVRGSLYISLEEGLGMVAERCKRLGVDTMLSDDVSDMYSATGLGLVILDSVQMTGAAVETVEAAVAFARSRGVPMILVCHETKGGVHAGPRTIEHLIDVSLMLTRQPRSIVCEKNRFGPAGCYLPLAMTARGLGYAD